MIIYFIYGSSNGVCAIDATGSPLPEKTIEICKKSRCNFICAIGRSKVDKDPSIKIRPETRFYCNDEKNSDLLVNITCKRHDQLIKNFH
jgi:3-isopropylmalate dehydrogenase